MDIASRIAEQRILAAQKQGEFNDLPGRGKPLNLEEWARTPEEWRTAITVLKNNGIVPREVTLLNKMAEIRRELTKDLSLLERQQLEKDLERTALEFRCLTEFI